MQGPETLSFPSGNTHPLVDLKSTLWVGPETSVWKKKNSKAGTEMLVDLATKLVPEVALSHVVLALSLPPPTHSASQSACSELSPVPGDTLTSTLPCLFLSFEICGGNSLPASRAPHSPHSPL